MTGIVADVAAIEIAADVAAVTEIVVDAAAATETVVVEIAAVTEIVVLDQTIVRIDQRELNLRRQPQLASL